MEEQLPFPSGTATAQLINVLHHLPPPDTTVRRRRGYQQIDEAVDEEEVTSEHPPSYQAVENTERAPEGLEHDGWLSLLWSFAFSAFVSVSVQTVQTDNI